MDDEEYEVINDADVAPPPRSVVRDYFKQLAPSVARGLAKGMAVHAIVYCGTAIGNPTIVAVVAVVKKVYDFGLL